jgi:fructokinase
MTIVGIGEALFDVFSDHQAPGGAPLNAVVHVQQLTASRNGRAVLVSRVGQDTPGSELLAQLRERGVDTSHMQTDPDRPTGEVIVDTSDPASPSYDILRGVAWDNIWFDPDDEELARRCEAVCFGSLAQRDAQSRSSIHRFVDTAAAGGRSVRLFDVNLRQNYFDQGVLRRSCELSTVVKLNESELTVVCDLLNLARDKPDADAKAAALRSRFGLRLVALTRGERGTVLYTAEGRIEGEPVSYPPAANADAVGAGDACTAGLLVGLVMRKPLPAVLQLANHCGAFVASQPGAVPQLPDNILQLV